MTVNVTCVKYGNKYSDEYVTKLKSMVDKNLKEDHTFSCYTDKAVEGVDCYELLDDNLPGWWQKLALFSLKKPMLYLDLDVVITGSLDEMCFADRFTIIKDWWQPCFNSSVMWLNGVERFVFELFNGDAYNIMNRFASDQEWITYIYSQTKQPFMLWPEEWCVSYKQHCRGKNTYPENSKVVVFHGKPDPHEVQEEWVKTQWT